MPFATMHLLGQPESMQAWPVGPANWQLAGPPGQPVWVHPCCSHHTAAPRAKAAANKTTHRRVRTAKARSVWRQSHPLGWDVLRWKQLKAATKSGPQGLPFRCSRQGHAKASATRPVRSCECKLMGTVGQLRVEGARATAARTACLAMMRRTRSRARSRAQRCELVP